MKRKNLTSSVLIHDAYWAIYEPAGQMLWQQLKQTDFALHVAAFEARKSDMPEVPDDDEMQPQASKPYVISNGIAIISICGPMSKAGATSFDDGCSTVDIRRQLRQAANDTAVTGILLRIDSPGGSVSGTQALADDVAAAVKKKPVYAYIEDLGCSAAYWVASQCEKVYCNETAIIGSIGTYMVVWDMSKMFAEAGVEVLLFATGEYKGSGTPGTVITDDQKNAFQATVDDLNDQFLAAVSRGRNMARKRVEQLADGNIHVGQKAKALGLVDDVMSMDDVLMRMSNPQRGRPKQRASAEYTFPFQSLGVLVYDGTQENDLTAESSPAGESVEEALKSAHAAVEGRIERVRKIKSLRAQEGRTISHKTLDNLRVLHMSLGVLIGECSALPTATQEEEPQAQAEPNLIDSLPDARSDKDAKADRLLADARADAFLKKAI